MWKYRQPGFGLQLLHELQDQQRGGLQCDILLQTEGVSVPAHGCVLSALSPVFSGALTNTPSVPVGHSRLVRLQAVPARALLKLVGFLYSGEMEGEGLGELQDVIDVAHRLGFSHLLDGLRRQMNRQQDKAVRWREVGLQTEDDEKEKTAANVQITLERKSLVHSGIQTDFPEAHFGDSCSIPESEESVASPFEQNDNSPTGADLVKDIAASSNSSDTSVPVHSRCYQQINKRTKVPKKVNKESQLSKICPRRNPSVEETQSELFKSRVLESVKGAGGKDFHELVEKLSFQSGRTFKEQGDTQISLKIKLKRRRGARWEIVGVQEESRSDEPASPGKTHSHIEDGVPFTQPQRNHPEVLQNPSPTFPRQGLRTITLTPPSELTLSPPATPANPASEQPAPLSTETGPPSSPLQMPPLSPGVLQSEESDEHIASLLEDMVMMGLNILPSVPVDGNNNAPHLSEKHSSPKPHVDLERCGDAAPAPPLCMNDPNLEPEGPVGDMPPSSGSFGPRETGSECPGTENQSKSRVELKSIPSLANHSKSSAITSPHVRSLKDAGPLFMLPCPAPGRDIAFSPEGLKPPHQNVGELRNMFNNLFWSADDVQTGEQTKSKTSEGHYVNLQTLKQCPAAWRDPKVLPHNSPRTSSQAALRQTSDFICATNCDDRADLTETRLPSCLSSLVLEDGQTDSLIQNYLRPLDVSSPHSALKPAWKSMRSSPVPQTAPGETDQQNLDHFIRQKAPMSLSSQSSGLGRSSDNSRSNKDYIQQTSEDKSEQAVTECLTQENQMFGEIKDVGLDGGTGELGLNAGPTKRSRLGSMVNEPKRKKLQMIDCVSTQFCSQIVKRAPCRAKVEVAEDINNTEHGDHPSSKKMYFLRACKSVGSVSTNPKIMKRLKSKKKSKEEDLDKNQPAKRKPGRPQKRRRPAGLKQQQDQEVKSNNSFTDFQASGCCEKDNLHLTQQSKTNSELEKMKDKEDVCLTEEHGCGRPSGKKEALGQSKSKLNVRDEPSSGISTYTGDRYLLKIKSKGKDGCEVYKTHEPEMGNAEVFAEETEQTRTLQSPKERTSDEVFHQTMFSVGSTVSSRLPSISQKLGLSFWDADISKTQTVERKRSAGPPPSLKFNKLKNRDLLRGGTIMKDCSEPEEKDQAEKRERVLDQSRDNNIQSESMSLNNGNGCLFDKRSETDTSRNQTDKISETVIAFQPDLSNPSAKLTAHLHIVPSARNLGQNCEMENDPECRSTKIFADVDTAGDFLLQESSNTQIVHQEACEEGLMGRQILRTEDEIMPSDEAITAKEALSVQLGEKPEESNPSTSSDIMGSTPASSAGVDVKTEVQQWDEEEEEVDVDVWNSPGTSPRVSAVKNRIIVLPEEEKEEEDEDEVDVTGDDTD